ncbi:TerB family tellurite resistance protein [Aureivirga marina]|uniref:TerB family tellurite resistance protein n=1 Tax=Aureivirga marina TaxID=1182451 RepID=UPI0018C91211|nr:TerB family tellurite resistance protein [Aureivirga marina]
MSFLNLYESGSHKRKIGHFANIVKLAKLNHPMNDGEIEILKGISKKLDLTNDEYLAIMEDPESFPIEPPISQDDRLERLYNLTHMIFLDRIVTEDERAFLNKIAVGLGFPVEKSEEIAKAAIDFFLNIANLENFKKALKDI